MFPSVCSIRSAQCAALIALAAAAGISRFEPATQPEPDAAHTTQSVSRSAPKRPVFHYPFALLAAATRLCRDTFDLTPSNPASELAGLCAPAPASPQTWFASANATGPVAVLPAGPFTFARPSSFAAVAVRQHRFPFAVGPPTREPNSTPRAARTRVPGDSPAYRMPASRIVSSFVRFFSFVRFPSAPFERNSRPRPTLAGSLSQPSLTLRGEPSLIPALSSATEFPSPAGLASLSATSATATACPPTASHRTRLPT